jgi:hypothetical protein
LPITRRNEIYRRVFNLEWVKENIPVDWTRRIAIISLMIILILAGLLSFNAWRGQRNASEQGRLFIEQFRATTEADARLTSLAGVYDLPGFEDRAGDKRLRSMT